ncbi:hypothetical protein GPOL_c08350 [Gordonia polyisoprenivorans VH2]|uniref:Uncharacterized protein n=1 Tax=Gordonia polyisoprenivorans (strain DSM 44266 / VH2) TaxID=1112204 RepID=H6MYM4_GORPV|nr:hypothetical protein GPOL_c08350 [Gordonia polyisoprenivorans VH2]
MSTALFPPPTALSTLLSRVGEYDEFEIVEYTKPASAQGVSRLLAWRLVTPRPSVGRALSGD